ncbi:hypothetical protein WJX77_005288 [Trebouxia sp. C0004]
MFPEPIVPRKHRADSAQREAPAAEDAGSRSSHWSALKPDEPRPLPDIAYRRLSRLASSAFAQQCLSSGSAILQRDGKHDETEVYFASNRGCMICTCALATTLQAPALPSGLSGLVRFNKKTRNSIAIWCDVWSAAPPNSCTAQKAMMHKDGQA